MKRLMTFLLTVACVVSLGLPAASSQEDLPALNDEQCTSGSPEIGLGNEATDQEQAILQKGLMDGTIPHIAPMDKIDIARTVAVADDSVVIYRIPLSGEFTDVDYILVQTSDDHIERVAETHIEEQSPDAAKLQVWVNGQLEFDDIVRESDASYQTRGVRDAWNAFNSCMNSAGVPMAVVAGISLACGFLGAFTAGTGVPACMIGAAGAFSGTVSFCYGRALKVL